MYIVLSPFSKTSFCDTRIDNRKTIWAFSFLIVKKSLSKCEKKKKYLVVLGREKKSDNASFIRDLTRAHPRKILKAWQY